MSTCLLCETDVTERPSVLVDFEGAVAEVCDECAAMADDASEDHEAMPREGLPEFNGAFASW